jgi:hypothetical protein
VAGLALADELVERAERLLGGRHLVVAMGVEQVDAVGLKALQRLVEDGEGLRLVGGPAEHVAAQAQRVHGEVGRRDVAHASNLPGAQAPASFRLPVR